MKQTKAGCHPVLLQFMQVSGCSDCTVVVGACGGLLRMDRCDKVQVGGKLTVQSSALPQRSVWTPSNFNLYYYQEWNA